MVLTEEEIFELQKGGRAKRAGGKHRGLYQFPGRSPGGGPGGAPGTRRRQLSGSAFHRRRLEGEFLFLSYAEGDKLYLPVDRLQGIHKFLGLEGQVPRLDRLGGLSWNKAKARVKKAVEKIAQELLDLYARRSLTKGFAFSPRDQLFKEFEAGFPYEETPDQLRAIEDVLSDMEAEKPMDRLVCGDVGYGKTEVALRAAFKTAMDGKQVAFLVPTTVLAEQHYQTMVRRFEGYPLEVRILSRFKSPKSRNRPWRIWPPGRWMWWSARTACCKRTFSSGTWV